MPHINLLYPFIVDDSNGDAFSTASDIMMPALAEMAPFCIKFDASSSRFFRHGKNCTLWLKPQSDTTLKSGEICFQCYCTVLLKINCSFLIFSLWLNFYTFGSLSGI